ncbi:MAG TPA: NAD(P)/FAD-dependent oxidoreductase [Gemmataceae bacterium]|jgi:phytoene dehydrogenase-like protein|nr:NAD(P)/FAD-dependent oxidoreductase [Gemmataceae bacterium]
MTEPAVLIVGAGLAGLACARRLREVGISFQIFEASDGVGGRVRTDTLDGFRLDRGFQFLLTAYPEAQRMLDYAALDLRTFSPGVLIRHLGRFHRIVDPRRSPLSGLKSILSPIGSVADKWRLWSLDAKVRAGKVEDQFARPEGLTLDFLRWGGRFSDAMIDRFFRPFCASLFLERDLVTSSRLFRFMFRMFVEGAMTVPALGMGAIPAQLAAALPAESIRVNTRVEAAEPSKVILSGGGVLTPNAVVVATDGPTAKRLLGDRVLDCGSRSVTCLYFAATVSPLKQPILALDGDGTGPVNHLAVMSDVVPAYAPGGQALVSASVLGGPSEDDATLESKVREQLVSWFGPAVQKWRHLRTYRIRHAIPDQTAPALDVPERPVKLAPGLFVCGAHRENATINGALASGFRAAQVVAEDLSV